MRLIDSLHALLFVASGPTPLAVLARAAGVTEGQAEGALEILKVRLEEGGPIQLQQIAGGWQLSTKPEFADVVTEFLKPEPRRLGKGVLEVLAIIAYRQPVTAGEIETLRGVSPDYGLRTLLERGLIHEVGRKKAPGRPVLYGTTSAFLHLFGLATLESLPPIALDAGANAAIPTLPSGDQPDSEDAGIEYHGTEAPESEEPVPESADQSADQSADV